RRREFSVLTTVSTSVRQTFAGVSDVSHGSSRESPGRNPLQPSPLPQHIARRLAAAMCTAVATEAGQQPRVREASQRFASSVVVNLVDTAENNPAITAKFRHLRHERQPIETPGAV